MSIFKHIFGQFKGPQPTSWRLEVEALHLKEFGLPTNTWLLSGKVTKVCAKISSIVQAD